MKYAKYGFSFGYLLTLCAVFLIGACKSSQSTKITQMATMTITQQNTRVTLLHVAKITSFSQEWIHGTEKGDGNIYAIPGVYVEFLVECLGSDEIEKINLTGATQFWINDEKVEKLDSVIDGGTSTVCPYSREEVFGCTPPVVEDESRAHLIKDTRRGVVLNSTTVDIKIQTGFNEESELFEFKNIPLF